MIMMSLSGCGKAEKSKENEVISNVTNNEINATVNETEQLEDSAETMETDSETESEIDLNLPAFSTEYDIVDYKQGYIIVSKNDGLLYGVLDSEGNIVIPVEYDNIEFVRKDGGRNNPNDQEYFICEYEGSTKVVDADGNCLLDGDIEEVTPYCGSIDENSPCFYQIINQVSRTGEGGNIFIDFYSQDIELLHRIEVFSNDDIDSEQCWIWTMQINRMELISNEYFLIDISGITSSDAEREDANGYLQIALYNMNGEMTYEWEEANRNIRDSGYSEKEEKFVFATLSSSGSVLKYALYGIDEAGNVTDMGTVERYDTDLNVLEEVEGVKDILTDTYYLGENNEYILYQSNDTWKLEDLAGNPLYDMRYYDCWHKKDCFFLMNEDDEMCLINQYGEKIIDYGLITWNGENGVLFGSVITDDNFQSDGQAACFAVRNGEMKDIYIFGEER